MKHKIPKFVEIKIMSHLPKSYPTSLIQGHDNNLLISKLYLADVLKLYCYDIKR